MKDKSLISHLRIWKSLTNNLTEIQNYDLKHKNYTEVKVDAIPLNVKES